MADTIQSACDELIATAKKSLVSIDDANWEDPQTMKAALQTTLGFHVTTLRMVKALADHITQL